MFSFLKNNKKDVKDYLKDLRGTQSIPATINEKERRLPISPYSQREDDFGSLVPKGPMDNTSNSSHGYPKPDVQSQQPQSQSQSHYLPSPPTPPPANPAPNITANPLQGSRAMMVGQMDQSFQPQNYQAMMYNSMMNPLRNSQMYLPVQSDIPGGMPMMIPYGYTPYMQPMQSMQMMPQTSFHPQMLKVSEAKEDQDEDAEVQAKKTNQKSGKGLPSQASQIRKAGRPKGQRKLSVKSQDSNSISKEGRKDRSKSREDLSSTQLPVVKQNKKHFRDRSKRRFIRKCINSSEKAPIIEQVLETVAQKVDKVNVDTEFNRVVNPLARAIITLDSRRKTCRTYCQTFKALNGLETDMKRVEFFEESTKTAKGLLESVGRMNQLRESHKKLMKMLEDLHDKVVAYALP